jgi:outer membrane biosynthesis protein TonB
LKHAFESTLTDEGTTMATAARTGVRGLSTDELQVIRDGLAAGRRPRVMFTESAGQIAGQVGQVVALTDPAESDEWVVVRFGRDELPFSPGDLQVAPKGPVKKAAPVPPQPARPTPEFVMDKPIPAPAPVAAPAPPPAEPAAPPAPAARKATARTAKPKPPPGLTVTLAYTDGEWTIAANQGSKALAKPYVVKPSEAMKIVQLVDVPGVQEAVEHIVSAERAEAEQQAERLRAELAEIEARLAELRDAG